MILVEIIKINEDKLKITLNMEDMLELGISYEDIIEAGKKTKSILISLLQQVKVRSGFVTEGSKLFIEAYKPDEYSCDLFFTLIRKSAKFENSETVIAPMLFEFNGAESMITGACKAFEYYSHRIYKSSLYLIGGKYRMLVYYLDYADRLSLYFFSEFGTKIGDDEILAAHTKEFGKELIANDALEVLSRHFG